jgi:hypothetical protein
MKDYINLVTHFALVDSFVHVNIGGIIILREALLSACECDWIQSVLADDALYKSHSGDICCPNGHY